MQSRQNSKELISPLTDNSSASKNSQIKNFRDLSTKELIQVARLLGIDHINLINNSPVLKPHLISIERSYRKTTLNLKSECIPWDSLLSANPLSVLRGLLVSNIETNLNQKDREYISEFFLRAVIKIQQGLLPAQVDTGILSDFYKEEKEKKSSQAFCLKSFFPNTIHTSLCQIPSYDLTRTSTGRMIVHKGPSILTLKKEYRSIIQSVYGKRGKIVSLDFSSLEPRVALNAFNSNIPFEGNDIYSFLNKEFFGSMISDRYHLKEIVSSYIHGYGDKSLQTVLKNQIRGAPTDKGIPLEGHRNHVSEVSAYLEGLFGKMKLQADFHDYMSKNGYIRNFFGRRLYGIKKNLEYSHYIQSTASDLSMFVFSDIIQFCKNNDYLIRPVFLIHDAILLDVPVDVVDGDDINEIARMFSDSIQSKYFSSLQLKIPFKLSVDY